MLQLSNYYYTQLIVTVSSKSCESLVCRMRGQVSLESPFYTYIFVDL